MDLLDLVFVLTVTACAVPGPIESRLYNDLLRKYNKLERPVSDETQPLNVSVGLNLIQILDVDEPTQVVRTSVWLRLEWVDNGLQWNEEDYPGVSALRVHDTHIWMPDITLYNSADEQSLSHSNILVTPTGHCVFIPRGIISTTCSMNMRWFPFDIQKCDLTFGSWTYDGNLLNVEMLEVDTSGFSPNREWHLLEIRGKKNVRMYSCCPDQPYPDITFTMVLQRRTLFYSFYLLLPCVLLSILAMLVFLLPADSGEKIKLSITVLLSLTVVLLLIAEIVPASSDSVPLIAQYFAAILVIVALSLIATVVALRFHHHDPKGSKMPKWIRAFLLDRLARLLCMKCPGPDPGLELSVSTSASQSKERAGEDEALLPKGQSSMEPQLSKFLEELRSISKHFRAREQEESARNEWKFAAAVIDRLCLVVFSVIMIFCTIVVLLSAPSMAKALPKD